MSRVVVCMVYNNFQLTTHINITASQVIEMNRILLKSITRTFLPLSASDWPNGKQNTTHA